MGKLIPISPTLLSTYLTCPRQFQAKYVTREVKFVQNEHAIYGDEIHKSMEATLKFDAALIPKAGYMKPLADLMRKWRDSLGMVMEVEANLCIDRDFKPSGWRDRWQGGKADVFFVDHQNARNIIVDWKTGKPKEDKTQSRLLSLCATKATGYARNECYWIHPVYGEVIQDVITLTDLGPVAPHLANVKACETAMTNDTYAPAPNGLCKNWCDVLSCPHNGKYKAS